MEIREEKDFAMEIGQKLKEKWDRELKQTVSKILLFASNLFIYSFN